MHPVPRGPPGARLRRPATRSRGTGQVAIRKLAGEPLVGFERDIPTRKETDRLLRAPRRRGPLRDGARQHRDHQARGRDRHRPRHPARAGHPAGGEAEVARRGAARRRGPAPAARHHPSPGQALLAGGREVHRVSCAQNERVARGGGCSCCAGRWRRLAAAARACRAACRRTPSACVRLQSERQVRGETLCEDAFSCYRPPGGDRRPHRAPPPGAVRRRRRARRPLPPGHAHERRDLRRRAPLRPAPLSRAGGRSHLEPRLPDARRPRERQSADSSQTLAGWTRDVFLEDAEWAATLRPRCRPGPALPRRLQLWRRDRLRPRLARRPAGRRADHPRRRAGRQRLRAGRRRRRHRRRAAAGCRLPTASALLRAVIAEPEQSVAGRWLRDGGRRARRHPLLRAVLRRTGRPQRRARRRQRHPGRSRCCSTATTAGGRAPRSRARPRDRARGFRCSPSPRRTWGRPGSRA